MILKQRKDTLGVATKEKNLFVLQTGLTEKIILVQERGQPFYRFRTNPKVQL